MSQNIPSEPRATRKDYVIVLTAQVVSLIFSPFYLPVMAFVPLLAFSYLNMLPIATKLVLLAMVYVFTILIPRFAIYLYRKFNGWTRHQLGKRERRFVPYLLSIASYAALLKQEGFPVARRTVAKYREAAGLPPARLRKE